MDAAVQAYVDAVPPEHRALFDRLDGLILALRPDATIALAYGMPTYKAADGRIHVGVWKHGLSIYGWKAERDGGFTERHPALRSSKGTLRLRPEDAAEISDDELRALVLSAFGS